MKKAMVNHAKQEAIKKAKALWARYWSFTEDEEKQKLFTEKENYWRFCRMLAWNRYQKQLNLLDDMSNQ